MKPTPQTLAEALDVIRAMHDELLAFRNPEFDLIAPGCEGEFDDRVKAVLAHSAPVINADRAAALPEASSSTKSQSQGLSFGDALKALKAGQRVARTGWNGKGMWLSLSCAPGGDAAAGRREIAAENFWSSNNSEYARKNGGSAVVLPCITMKTATGEILMGWLASQTDMLADDWMVLA